MGRRPLWFWVCNVLVLVWILGWLWMSGLSILVLDGCDKFRAVDPGRIARCEQIIVRDWMMMLGGQVVVTIGALLWGWFTHRTLQRAAALTLAAATSPLLLVGFFAMVGLDGRLN